MEKVRLIKQQITNIQEMLGTTRPLDVHGIQAFGYLGRAIRELEKMEASLGTTHRLNGDLHRALTIIEGGVK